MIMKTEKEVTREKNQEDTEGKTTVQEEATREKKLEDIMIPDPKEGLKEIRNMI